MSPPRFFVSLVSRAAGMKAMLALFSLPVELLGVWFSLRVELLGVAIVFISVMAGMLAAATE
jgi:hypothetical protein